MFQPTQQRISEKIKSTLDSDALPFHEILDADMVESAMASEGVQFKDRIYTPFVTLCMFLSQVLDQDHSCRAAVMRLILWMALNDRKSCSAETSYCQVPATSLKVIVRLVHATAEKIEAGASDVGFGKDVACRWSTAPPPRCQTRRGTSEPFPRRTLRASVWDSP